MKTFKEYQEEANRTAVYEHSYYPFASLMVEAAEFADIVTKWELRGDKQGPFRDDLIAEAGDVLWNLAECLTQYNITMEEVAAYNIEKLRSRSIRGVLKGNGGDR